MLIAFFALRISCIMKRYTGVMESQKETSVINNEDEESKGGTTSETKDTTKAKRRKPGIIYLSTLPPYMNVIKVREIFGAYGELGRVFLQPYEPFSETNKKKKKLAVHFTEGWIEFKRKKIAKQVASTLNNTLIGGRKKSKFYDHMWSIKYLPRFKWFHLSERLAYERAVRKQKLRTVVEQVKREASYFKSNVEKTQKMKKKKIELDKIDKTNEFKLRETDSVIMKNKSGDKEDDRIDFLKSIFS